MSEKENFNLDEWRKNAFERMRAGQPKIVVQPSEDVKQMREKWNKWRQNPTSDSSNQNSIIERQLFRSKVSEPIIEKAERAVKNGEKILSESILKEFAIKWAESYEHEEMYYKSFPRIAAQIGNKRLIDAISDIVIVISKEGLNYGEAFELRFDVFSDEFIQALKAIDRDGLVVKHLQIYVKYRNFCAN